MNPGRIPPFRRNEFGFTNGGPVVLPHLYDGRGKTFYFGEYQGFRQVLGTTQVFPVPTADERAGVDTTAYTGDTLIVPVDPGIATVLARYPLPNYVQGAYGIHTFATSAKVTTNADQFSIRMDHQQGANHFFGRVSFDNLTGPTTNPDQTVLDPSFGVAYIDRQRNLAFDFARNATKRLTMETMFSITRTTPRFVTTNHTDPAVKFNDSLFETFNVAGGLGDCRIQQSLRAAAKLRLYDGAARISVWRRGAAESGYDVLRHQPEWRVRLWRRQSVFQGGDDIAERCACYSRGRSTAGYSFQFA